MKYENPELKLILSAVDAIMASAEQPPVEEPEEPGVLTDENPELVNGWHVLVP